MEHGLHAKMVQSSGKCSLTLHSCISVTDRVKINEQNKSIDIGPLYLLITPTESYGGFEPGGVSNDAILARSKCKTPKWILP